jgi:hypothetical protein
VKDDTDFLKQPEIKTALAYLYIINNISHPIARGTEAWWRIFHYNNALSQEDSIRIGEHLKKKWVTFQEAIYHHIGELGLSKSGLETISNVKKRIDSLCSKTNLDVSDLILEVYDQSGLSMQFSHTDTKHSREALDFKELIDSNWQKIDPAQDAETILDRIKDNKKGLKFNPASMTFSYSSISTYEKCPRQYELKELLRMPTRDSEDSTGAMNRGTFVHKVLEIAVIEKITTKERLYEIRDTVAKEPDFRGVDIETATEALDVFWERNKNRIANNLMVEQRFAVPLGGFTFKGFIDRKIRTRT